MHVNLCHSAFVLFGSDSGRRRPNIFFWWGLGVRVHMLYLYWAAEVGQWARRPEGSCSHVAKMTLFYHFNLEIGF